MKHFTTEHEARAAIKDVIKRNPGCEVYEAHVDSKNDRNWYVYIKTPGNEPRIIFRCKWSSPIIKFK